MPSPKVSVIVPNYNHAPYLERRLRSVLDQTVRDIEVIFLDDASPDDSLAVFDRVAAGDARVRLVRNEQNSGSTFKQWNKGVGLAAGEYVWIAESDDAADPRFLEVMLDRLDRHPRAALAYCRSTEVDPVGAPTGRVLPAGEAFAADFVRPGREHAAEHLTFTNTVPNASGVVFRRAAYLAAGGADESFRLTGDWRCWIDLCLQGDVAYTAEPLNLWRWHPNSVRAGLGRSAAGATETLRVARHMLDRVRPPARVREAVRMALYCLFFFPGKLDHLPPADRRKLRTLARTVDPWLPVRLPYYYWLRARGRI